MNFEELRKNVDPDLEYHVLKTTIDPEKMLNLIGRENLKITISDELILTI
ncbi:hypothetical protein [uncultured Winogradskyella sp.]|nr:hypothetical protein [uncultured Winogradskyella sp.]